MWTTLAPADSNEEQKQGETQDHQDHQEPICVGQMCILSMKREKKDFPPVNNGIQQKMLKQFSHAVFIKALEQMKELCLSFKFLSNQKKQVHFLSSWSPHHKEREE